MKLQPFFLALLLLLAGCSSGGIRVKTPLQGEILVPTEREAQRASRALLDKIDESQEELESIVEQSKKAIGPTKRAEREDLEKRRSELDAGVKEVLKEFLGFVPKVLAQGWVLQPFDESRYFYYSYQFKDLLPKAESGSTPN
ncbi:MAG: hypothetical protein H7Y37_12605 [Anaerolineae bacterium]|nr:hypothetical protein [Gloeobacterales cyanobacterium ES-bin-313]